MVLFGLINHMGIDNYRVLKSAVCILLLVAILSINVSCYEENIETQMRKFFNQPQWENIDFSNGKNNISSGIPTNISPYLSSSDEVYTNIFKASVEAGIVKPVLPHEIDFIPEGAKYYCVSVHEDIDDAAYEVRFHVFFNQNERDIIYSIWISAIPLVWSGFNYATTDKEFIFSVNNTPEEIRETIKLHLGYS